MDGLLGLLFRGRGFVPQLRTFHQTRREELRRALDGRECRVRRFESVGAVEVKCPCRAAQPEADALVYCRDNCLAHLSSLLVMQSASASAPRRASWMDS